MALDISFRTAGAWGAGSGANLAAARVDQNFYALKEAVEDLQENPPDANAIANIVQSGDNITVYLQDGTTYGPFALPTASPLIPLKTVSGASYTLLLADRGSYIRCTNAAGCGVVVPAEGETSIPVGSEYYFRQAAAGGLSFEAGCDVTLNGITGYQLATDGLGAVATLKKVATDEWDLFGLLAADVTA